MELGELTSDFWALSADEPQPPPVVQQVQPARDAEAWLREQLTGQDRRIGDLTRMWCRREEKWWKEDLEALMDAKNYLKLMSYVGRDGRFWWELPEEDSVSQHGPKIVNSQ